MNESENKEFEALKNRALIAEQRVVELEKYNSAIVNFDLARAYNSLKEKLAGVEKERDEMWEEIPYHPCMSSLQSGADGVKALKQERDAALAELTQLREAAVNLLNNDSAYPLNSVAEILVEGIQILLNEKSYDGHGHERLAIARNYATLIPKAVEFLNQAISQPITAKLLKGQGK